MRFMLFGISLILINEKSAKKFHGSNIVIIAKKNTGNVVPLANAAHINRYKILRPIECKWKVSILLSDLPGSMTKDAAA